MSIDELAGLVSSLGILVKDVDLIAIMRELDTNKKGFLEFEDFSQFVLVDPYTKYWFNIIIWIYNIIFSL